MRLYNGKLNCNIIGTTVFVVNINYQMHRRRSPSNLTNAVSYTHLT